MSFITSPIKWLFNLTVGQFMLQWGDGGDGGFGGADGFGDDGGGYSGAPGEGGYGGGYSSGSFGSGGITGSESNMDDASNTGLGAVGAIAGTPGGYSVGPDGSFSTNAGSFGSDGFASDGFTSASLAADSVPGSLGFYSASFEAHNRGNPGYGFTDTPGMSNDQAVFLADRLRGPTTADKVATALSFLSLAVPPARPFALAANAYSQSQKGYSPSYVASNALSSLIGAKNPVMGIAARAVNQSVHGLDPAADIFSGVGALAGKAAAPNTHLGQFAGGRAGAKAMSALANTQNNTSQQEGPPSTQSNMAAMPGEGFDHGGDYAREWAETAMDQEVAEAVSNVFATGGYKP